MKGIYRVELYETEIGCLVDDRFFLTIALKQFKKDAKRNKSCR